MNIKHWNTLTVLAALLLCVLSLALPVAQWAAIPATLIGQVLAGSTALALGLCKLAFFPLGWQQLQQRRWLPGICLLAFAALLLAVSISASRDLLLTASDSRQKTEQQLQQQGNIELQVLTEKLDSLNQQIKTLNRLIALDADNHYREGAYQQGEKLQALELQRGQVMQQLQQAQQGPAKSTQARFGFSLALAEHDNNHDSSALLIATVIHIGCVLSVLATSSWQLSAIDENSDKKTASLAVKAKEKAAVKSAEEKQPSKPIQLNSEQLELAKNIVAGVHGNNPSIKAIIQAGVIVGGFNKVKPVFEQLHRDNKIERNGQRFALIQEVIEA